MKSLILIMCLLLPVQVSLAAMGDDPWLTKVMTEVEYLQDDGEDVVEWNIDAWVGRDLSKFWLKSSGEYADSEFEDANIEFVYSRAVSAYWDQQLGVRHDFKHDPDGDNRNWVSYGYIGTAPYFIAVDARVFVGEESSSQLLIELERELMLTQEWVLTSELDIVANGNSNRKYQEGSGLAEVEFSLRLGYERDGNRKFQPFVGITARQTFGKTKDFAQARGLASGSLEGIIGINSWF
ncbi:MAG: copper resistance protein B [Arenicella sp.]|nr:copper resistance protein B [Arenicella sp.]